MHTIKFSKHADTRAWGRNGRFIPAFGYTHFYREGIAFDVDVIGLDIDSSKNGDQSPIQLRMTIADARAMIVGLETAIAEAGIPE